MTNQYLEKTKNKEVPQFVKDALLGVPFPSLLEIGCGAGAMALHAESLGYTVTCLDKSEESFEMARGRGLTVHHQRFEYWDDKKQYDVILAINSLQFVDPSALPKVKQLLKPGGILIASVFGPNDDWVKDKSVHLVDVEALGLTTEYLAERSDDSPGHGSPMKHWHVFDVVMRKQ